MHTHSDTIVRFPKIICKSNSVRVGIEDMYTVYAVCKQACVHSAYNIYTATHVHRYTHTHTHTCTNIDIHTILLAVIINIENKYSPQNKCLPK